MQTLHLEVLVPEVPVEGTKVQTASDLRRVLLLDGEEFAEILRYAHSQGLCDSATSCSRTEFVLSMLLKLDKVDREDIQQCVAAFNGLDRDHSGRLDAGDVLAAADAVV